MGYLGSQSPVYPYIELGLICSHFHLLYFFLLIPLSVFFEASFFNYFFASNEARTNVFSLFVLIVDLLLLITSFIVLYVGCYTAVFFDAINGIVSDALNNYEPELVVVTYILGEYDIFFADTFNSFVGTISYCSTRYDFFIHALGTLLVNLFALLFIAILSLYVLLLSNKK